MWIICSVTAFFHMFGTRLFHLICVCKMGGRGGRREGWNYSIFKHFSVIFIVLEFITEITT